MNSFLPHVWSAARSGVRPFVFVWSSWRGLAARDVRYMLLFAVAVAVMIGTGELLQSRLWGAFLSEFQDTLVPAVLLILSLAVAAQVKTTTFPKWVPYIVAATVALVLSMLLIIFVINQLYECVPNVPCQPLWRYLWLNVPPRVLLCYLAALGYMSMRDARHRADVLRGVQLDRARLSRSTFESRLQATQARVEPQFLFDTLGDIERLYEVDSHLAERMLDDLIAYLRAALPSLRESTSTLGTELALANAWVDIIKIRRPDLLAVTSNVTGDALDACMPPTVLLPLIDHAIQVSIASARADKAIALDAVVADGRLRISLTDPGSGFASRIENDVTARIRERLRAVYGDDAVVAFHDHASGGSQAVVEVPYEPTNRNHR